MSTQEKVVPDSCSQPTLNPHHKPPHRWPMILIGISKVSKATGLLILAIGLHYFLNAEWRIRVHEFVDNVRLEPHNRYLTWAFEKILAVNPKTLNLVRIGSFVYAALYYIEGIGIFLDKKWAEWMVVVTTAGFLPVELYEITREPTIGRCLLYIANIIIMVYLLFRLRRQAVIKRENAADPPKAVFNLVPTPQLSPVAANLKP